MKLEAEIKVEDVMAKDLVTVGEDLALAQAAKMMLENGISSLAIRRQEKIVGILTERDFVKCAAGKCDSTTSVGRIMSTQLVTIEPSADLLEAGRVMGKNRIRHLLVKKDDEIIGILSLRDVLRVLPESIYGYLSQKGAL